MNYKNKKVLIIGMKSSGTSAAALLQNKGAKVYFYDDEIKEIAGFSALDDFKDENLKTFSAVIVSPAIANDHSLLMKMKRLGITIKSELDLGCSFLNCPQIVVTGTNGKTTVVTMIEKLLSFGGYKVKAMGNIGYPVSQVVLDGNDLDYAVVEASSFQLEYAEVKPYISIIMNVAPDHMDRYEKYSDYIDAKKRVCKNQSESDYLIFNNDDGIARSFIEKTKAKGIAVSTKKNLSPVHIKDNYFMDEDISLCPVKSCKLRGDHNKFNMLVALNVGKIVGVRKESLVRLIKEYTLLPNRIEYVTTIDGKKYYNDSKGTNIHACRFAVGSLDGSVGLIMGGSDKNEDFCDFFENIDKKVKEIAITGGNAEKIYDSAMKMGYTSVAILPSLTEAVRYLSQKEDVENVLLSPCCASFDRYKNYAERGEKFKEAVYAIQSK